MRPRRKSGPDGLYYYWCHRGRDRLRTAEPAATDRATVDIAIVAVSGPIIPRCADVPLGGRCFVLLGMTVVTQKRITGMDQPGMEQAPHGQHDRA